MKTFMAAFYNILFVGLGGWWFHPETEIGIAKFLIYVVAYFVFATVQYEAFVSQRS